MNCKVKITCKCCACSMEINANKFQASGQIICQNCGQKMPDGTYEKLSSAMTALASLNADTCEFGWEPDEKGFLLSLHTEPAVTASDQ